MGSASMETSEKRPVSNSFWRAWRTSACCRGLPDAQRQQPVQLVARERLVGRIEVDPPDGAAFEDFEPGRSADFEPTRYGAEQQRQEHQHRRTHVSQ